MSHTCKPSRTSRAWRVLKRSVLVGGRTGLKTSFDLLIVMVPVIVIMTVLEALGALGLIEGVFAPVMELMGLPGNSALVFISGMAINLYTAVAVAANVALTMKQMTVIAVLCQVCHNLPVECAVQKKAGTGVLWMLVVRFVTGILGALALSWIIPETGAWAAVVSRTNSVETLGTWELIGSRAATNGVFLVKIVGIVMALMIAMELLRETGALKVITVLMRPLTWLAGLPKQAGFTVMTSTTLGLAYGAGTVIAEARAGHLSREEQFRTNVFIGTTHSLFEDVALFAVIGASLVWMVVSRLVIGAVAVRLFAVARWALCRRARPPAPADAHDSEDSPDKTG